MDFFALFTSDEFGKYHALLVDEVAGCLSNAIDDSKDGVPKAVRDVLIKVVRFPYKTHRCDATMKMQIEMLEQLKIDHIKHKLREMDGEDDAN